MTRKENQMLAALAKGGVRHVWKPDSDTYAKYMALIDKFIAEKGL